MVCSISNTLYIPLLYRWYKDSNITNVAKKLFNFNLGFLFVDIEGNILFIPEIRWLFHRNDLIVAHAHVAMELEFFYGYSYVYKPYKELHVKIYKYIFSWNFRNIFVLFYFWFFFTSWIYFNIYL